MHLVLTSLQLQSQIVYNHNHTPTNVVVIAHKCFNIDYNVEFANLWSSHCSYVIKNQRSLHDTKGIDQCLYKYGAVTHIPRPEIISNCLLGWDYHTTMITHLLHCNECNILGPRCNIIHMFLYTLLGILIQICDNVGTLHHICVTTHKLNNPCIPPKPLQKLNSSLQPLN